MRKELVKQIVKVGNGAGVLLPRELLGGTAKVEIIERPLDIEKDILEILNPYLHNLRGVYIVGSYSRAEQKKESDVDVIAISDELNKEIMSGKYHIFIYSIDRIKKTLEKNPILIYPRILEAKAIFNKSLLKEFLLKDIKKDSFKHFFEETKGIIKINKEMLKLDKEINVKSSPEIIYSLVLRLRGLFIIECIIKNGKYSHKSFNLKLREHFGRENSKKIYGIYQDVKNGKKIKENVDIGTLGRLILLVEEEVNKYER